MAITVIAYITADVAQQGIFAIPVVIGQFIQILIGSALVGYFVRELNRTENFRSLAVEPVVVVEEQQQSAGKEETVPHYIRSNFDANESYV